MRRLERGAGRRNGAGDAPLILPAAGARQSGPRAGAAPARRLRSRHPGDAGAPPGGTTASRQELADGGARIALDESVARDRKEAAAGRREARRPASWAGDLRRSGDGPGSRGGPEGAAFPHRRLSALCSPHFSGERKTDKGHPAPSNRAAERWLNHRIERRMRRAAPYLPLYPTPVEQPPCTR